MKKITLFALMLLGIAVFLAAAEPEKVRVTVNNANVRSDPRTTAVVVLKAAKDDVFVVLGKTEGWYRIRLPEETGSESPEGYINESVVELLARETAAEPGLEKAPARAPHAKPAAQRASPPVEKLFSGLSAKFGIMTQPAARFGDRWLLAIGYDKGINPFLAAGLELQPYFRSFSDADFSDTTIGANLFLNAKGGVNIGRFAESLKLLTPYLGVGLGGAMAFSSSKSGSEKVSDFAFNFAWHMMFGIEVELKGMSAILEFQILKVSLPDINPDPTQYFWMFGVRF